MRISAIVLTAGILVASPAVAHPKLVSSSPAASATAVAPARVSLVFSERLLGNLSRAQVIMTGMPGMAHHQPMRIAGKSAVSADGKSLTVTFAKPLTAGSYRITYRVVSADTHKVGGGVDFKVR